MKKTILTSSLALALVTTGFARTWTSADGSQTFEGDFVSSDDTTVTVKKGFKPMTFKLAILSEADRNWIKEAAEKQASAKDNVAAAEEFAKSDFGKALKKVKKLDGKRFSKSEIAGAPEYFILYYSASW